MNHFKTDRTRPLSNGQEVAGMRIPSAAGLFGKLVALVAAIAVLIAGVLVLSAVHLLPQLRNPFAETTTDRSGPVLLKSITALSRYEAASGSFQVVFALCNRSLVVASFPVG